MSEFDMPLNGLGHSGEIGADTNAMTALKEVVAKVEQRIPSDDEVTRRLRIEKDRYYTDCAIAEMYQANGSEKPPPEEPTRESVVEMIREENGILEF